MSILNKLLFVLAIAFMAGSCNENSGGFNIEGTVSGAQGLKVYFDKTLPNAPVEVLNNVDANDQGSFEINLEENPGAGVYRLRIGAKSGALILDGTETDITINGELNTLERAGFEVEGCPSTARYNEAMTNYLARKMQLDDIKEYLENEENPLAAMQFALNTLNARADFAPMHRSVFTSLKAEYPENGYTDLYGNYVKQMEQSLAMQQAKQRIKVGMPAPDIELPGPDGEVHRLSDLKGKIVLLDFWASWCGPCRKENPKVVRTYDKYKDQGFTVFSVSLDGLDARTKARYKNDPNLIEQQMKRSKERWVGAIKSDNLKWDTHVSELAKWDTQAAKKYGVSGIPRTYLIDRDGKIAAINPRYNLEEQIQKLL